MAQQVGLQVFNANDEVYLDLTNRPTVYVGEADIYPTDPVNRCSGTFGVRLSKDYYWYKCFYVIEKIYLNSIDFMNHNYIYPFCYTSYDSSSKEVYFFWDYTGAGINDINVPVRIKYGVY